jgi:hypothetical protein
MGYVDKIREIEWQIRILPTVAHGNGQRNFFHLFHLAILNSCILFSSLGVRKFRIAMFGTPYWGIYWHRLDMNAMCKGQLEGHLLQPLKSLDLKNVAGSIGLFHLPRKEDMCVQARVSPEMFQ